MEASAQDGPVLRNDAFTLFDVLVFLLGLFDADSAGEKVVNAPFRVFSGWTTEGPEDVEIVDSH